MSGHMEFKTYHTYLVTNKNHTVLYIGVTSALRKRVWEHKTRMYPHSFTSRYNVDELVYYEAFFDIGEAIAREKQLKGGSRIKKIELINSFSKQFFFSMRHNNHPFAINECIFD